MKSIFLFLITAAILILFTTLTSAQDIEPVINKNVHVMKNVTPAQCPTSWKGSALATDIANETGRGASNNEVAAGIRSCDSCAYDQASRDCVCATCYDNYN